MAVIRGNAAASMLPDAIVLDLGDLARQGKILADRAEAEAAAIVEQARLERDRLMSGASERGYGDGRAAGFAQGLAEGRNAGHAEALEAARIDANQVIQAWSDALEAFEQARQEVIAASRQDVIRFAVLFAERVTRRMIELDTRAIEPIMAEAISMVMAGSAMSVRVSQKDIKVAREVLGPILDRLSVIDDVHLVEDSSLSHGSCVVRTRAGRIEASIDAMIDRMVKMLLPGEAGGTHQEVVGVAPAAEAEVEVAVEPGDGDADEAAADDANGEDQP